jgi:hypothetical protein
MQPMFERAKYQWRRKRTIRLYDADMKKARAKKDDDEFESLHQQMGSELSDLEDEINRWETLRLIRKARFYDIELPPTDDQTLWERSWNQIALSAKGRTLIRRLIDEEKTRRFEVTVRWIKLMSPLIAALAGLIGTITGLVAVSKKH